MSAALCCLALLLQPTAGEVRLTEQGRPLSTIVVTENAAGCVTYAAQELRETVLRCSGADLPLLTVPAKTPLADLRQHGTLVLLGKSAATHQLELDPTDLKPDGFRLRTFDGGVAIVGQDDPRFNVDYDARPSSAGTLYGVYRLLETLGCRWFYPAEVGTITPHLPTIELAALDVRDEPCFAYRFVGYGKSAMPWQRRIGAGGDRDLWATRHTFNQTIKLGEKYGEAHPEWFLKTADGRRTNSLDLGRLDAVPAIADEAEVWLKAGRPAGKRYFLVIPADGTAGSAAAAEQVAQAARERGERGAMSDVVAACAAAVANELARRSAPGNVVYCAYSNYYLPPRNLPRFPANLDLLIAQPRYGFYDSEAVKAADANLNGWLKLKPPQVAFCRYYGSLRGMVPAFMPGIISDDLKRLKGYVDRGAPVVGEMNFNPVQAGDPTAWWMHLNVYLNSKLLWHPEADVDALIDDYCTHFYGPGAKPMRAFWDRLAELYLDPTQRAMYRIETIDQLEGWLNQAKQLSRGTTHEPATAFIGQGFEDLRMLRAKQQSAQTSPTSNGPPALAFSFDTAKPGDATIAADGGRVSGQLAGGTLVDGLKGRALSLSGEGSGVALAGFDLSQTDYTIAAWVQPARPLFRGTFWIVGPAAFERCGLRLKNGSLELIHRTQDGGWRGMRLACPGPPLGFIPGQWHQVVGTFSQRDGMALYLDGELRGLHVRRTEPSVHPITNLGASGGIKPTECFPGLLDEVSIWRRELSAAEVRERYEQMHPRW